MADSEGPSDADVVASLTTKLFPWLVAALAVYLLWRFNAWKGLLALLGTIILGRVAWIFWVHYIRQDFISGIEYVLLEIVPPRDVERSPLAMELFLSNALYHWSMKGGREEYWQGAVWFWFSLEIASIDGQVHFYIRTPSRIRSLIETQMYAQYPQSQVKVVEDYTLAVDEITPESKWNAWGCEFRLVKPEAFPIKTYVNFGLDEDPKEEYKVDPISPLIEFFGSLQKGEQAWLQIVITPAKKMWKTKGTWFGKHDWIEETKIQVKALLYPYARQNKTYGGAEGAFNLEFRTPDFLKNTITAMNLKTGKLGFETGIRLMYVAPKTIYPMGKRTNASRDIRLVMRQYALPDCNEFYRFNSAQGDALGSGIMGLSSKEVMVLANRMLHEYRERAFYHLPLRHHLFHEHTFLVSSHWTHVWYMFFVKRIFLPYIHHQTYILNTEELATIWHFPGQILKVPTLERIESKEASPPTNLPV